MSLRRKLTGASLWLGLIFAFSAATYAQQPVRQDGNGQKAREGRMGRRPGGPGKGEHGGIIRLMSHLNLTDAQQQQLRAIQERFETSTKTQREELRKLRESNEGSAPSADTQTRMQALRSEVEQAMKGTRKEMLAILTAEQRTQLEQLVKERKARHEEKRGRRPDQQNENNNQ
ncbi:MAG: motif family protein [Acidobacteriota bacterium]|jgi:Spy/CpxP family protein refolding chaperone|nr:motif family protein [Acidobacteriota bacterium]